MKKSNVIKAVLVSACIVTAMPTFASANHHGKQGKSSHYGYVKTVQQAKKDKKPVKAPHSVPELSAASATIVGSMALGLIMLSAERRRRKSS